MVIDMKKFFSIILFAAAILCSCKKEAPTEISFLGVEDTLRLVKGTTYQLQVALSPKKSVGNIRFSSEGIVNLLKPYSNEPSSYFIVDVDEQGLISANGIGEAPVWATVLGGHNSVYKKVIVVVEPNPNEYYDADFDGRKLVDLGLSVLWCSTNVGTDKIDGWGELFAWGETTPRPVDGQVFVSDYKFYPNGYNSCTKYTDTDGLTILESVDDAVTNYSSWARTPTKSEWEELFGSCTRYWTGYNGITGVVYTARNGHQIFFPTGMDYASSSIGSSDHSTCFSADPHAYHQHVSDLRPRCWTYPFRGVVDRR